MILPTTEKELSEFDVPFFDTEKELFGFIRSLDVLNNDYGTAALAMSLAGQAAFKYIAHKFGCTGFQAGYADLHMLGQLRNIKGPYMIIKLEDAIYPQYNLMDEVSSFISENRTWLRDEAKKKLADRDNKDAHPEVINHWEQLAKEE